MTSTYSDGEGVTNWSDISGNNNHAYNMSGALPTYETNEVNGLPLIRFTGVAWESFEFNDISNIRTAL